MDENKTSQQENEVVEAQAEETVVAPKKKPAKKKPEVVEAQAEVAEEPTEVPKKKPAKKKPEVVEEPVVETQAESAVEVKAEEPVAPVKEEVKAEPASFVETDEEAEAVATTAEPKKVCPIGVAAKSFFAKAIAWVKANKLISIIIASAVVAVILALSIALPLCLKDDEPIEHTHAYLTVIDAKYLASEADCTHKATYYKSCTCGLKSEETFTTGDYKHTWGEIRNSSTLLSDADCHTYASYQKSCSLCGTLCSGEDSTFYYTAGGYGDHKNVESKDGLAATCTTAGYTAGEYCSDCGQWLSGHATVQALTHNYVLDNDNCHAATCTTDGINAYKCSNPGCTATRTEIGDLATGHSVATLVQVSEEAIAGSDCCAYSVVYGGTCSKCEQQINNDPVTEERHSFYTKVTQEPTCVAEGVKSVLCSNTNCKYHNTAKSTSNFANVAGTGHTWGTPSIAGSIKTYTCTNPGCSEHKEVFEATGGSASLEGIANVEAVELSFGEDQPAIQLGDGMGALLGEKTNVSISAGNLDEGAKAAAVATLPADKKALLGDAEIFNFSISSDEGAVTNFGDEVFVTVRIPYTLKEGEDANNIAIWYINDEGDVTTIDADYSNGEVVFQTNHFSLYAPAQMTAAEYCAKNGHPTDEQTRVEATCTTAGYVKCLHCGYVEDLPATGHDIVETETKAVSCTENGTKHYACKNCDVAYDKEILATGHAYEVTEQEDASCTKAGHTTYTCSKCQDSYTDTIGQTNHSYTEETVAPTCTEDGYTKKTCSACGISSESNYVKALGHTPAGEYLSSANGHWQKCSVCGENCATEVHTPDRNEATEEVAVKCTVCGFEIAPIKGHEHKYNAVVTEPTCTAEGYTTYTCDCGNTYVDNYVAKVAHTIDYTVMFTGKEPTCSICGSTPKQIAISVYYYVNGEQVMGGELGIYQGFPIDDIVNYVISSLAQQLKGYSNVKYDKATQDGKDLAAGATIETAGTYNLYFTADVCAHEWETIVYREATCTTIGVSGEQCTKCGATQNRVETPELGHDPIGEWQSSPIGHWKACSRCEATVDMGGHEPDYDEATTEHGITCTVCGYVIAEALADDTGDTGDDEPDTPVDPEPDKPIQRVTIVTYLINEYGEQERLDDYSYSMIEEVYSTDTLDDIFDLGVIVSDYNARLERITCNGQEIDMYTCFVENGYYEFFFRSEGDDNPEEPEEPIDECYHDPIYYGEDAKQYMRYDDSGHWYECPDCHERIDAEKHWIGNGEEVAATCTTSRGIKYTCLLDGCGYSYIEYYDEQPLGHNYEYKYDENNHWQECSRCHEQAEAVAHNFNTEVLTAPTCFEEGCTLHTCDCGYSYEEQVPASHTYVERIVAAPTCTEDGQTKYICTVCHEVRLETVPATGHSYLRDVTYPTCTEDGYTSYRCPNCGDEYIEDVVPATGHRYEWVTTEDGHYQECYVCGETTEFEAHSFDGDQCECGYSTAQPLENVSVSIVIQDNYDQVEISNMDLSGGVYASQKLSDFYSTIEGYEEYLNVKLERITVNGEECSVDSNFVENGKYVVLLRYQGEDCMHLRLMTVQSEDELQHYLYEVDGKMYYRCPGCGLMIDPEAEE